MIIKENGKSVDNKIDYIYLLLHRMKADKISSQYIYLKRRVVEAIRSYCEIILQYHNIVESKRSKIKKLEIEKKIALLLLVLAMPEEAAKIY